MPISLENAYLTSLVVSTTFYGAFIALYGTAMYILLFVRRTTRSQSLSALFFVSAMFAVSTMHIIISYIRTVNAIVNRRSEPGGAFAYLNETTDPTYLFQDTLYGLQTLLGDSFVMYRLYVVYEKDNRILVSASLVFIGSVACALGTLISEGTAAPGTSVFDHKAWISSFMALTLFTNFTSTTLIALRLWFVEREVSGIKNDRYLTRVAMTVIESGAIYSISLISLLITFILADWSQYIPLFLMVQIIGITFALFIVRIGLRAAAEDTMLIATFEATEGLSHIPHDPEMEASFAMVQISRVTEVRHLDHESTFELDGTVRQRVSGTGSETAFEGSCSSIDITKGQYADD